MKSLKVSRGRSTSTVDPEGEHASTLKQLQLAQQRERFHERLLSLYFSVESTAMKTIADFRVSNV